MNVQNNSATDATPEGAGNVHRKTYSREIMWDLYVCSPDIPDYLAEFSYLQYNNAVEENWCKKPLPKFENVELKPKGNYQQGRYKGRQRTISNQSGDNSKETEYSGRQRTYTGQSESKYKNNFRPTNRPNNNSVSNNSNESLTASDKINVNPDDFTTYSHDVQWQKVENKYNRTQNPARPYSQNLYANENHWKKWSKENTFKGDRSRPQNMQPQRLERNNWAKKIDHDQSGKKMYSSSFNNQPGQTEDLWQDDWDTEMKSEILVQSDINLDELGFSQDVEPILPLEDQHIFDGPNLPQSPDDSDEFNLWYYIDLSDIEQGPFPSRNMANWLATGYFNSATLIRRKCDERFLVLAEFRALYGRIPFIEGVTIPPISKETEINVDIAQLLVGVDKSLLPHVLKNSCVYMNQQQLLNEQLVAERQAEIDRRVQAELDVARQKLIQEQEEWKVQQEQEKEKWKLLKEQEMQSIIQDTLARQVFEKPCSDIMDVEALPEPLSAVEDISNSAPVPVDMTEEVPDIDVSASVKVDEGNSSRNDTDWQSIREINKQKKSKKTKNKQQLKSPAEVSDKIKDTSKVLSPVIVNSKSIASSCPVKSSDEVINEVKPLPKTESSVYWNIPPSPKPNITQWNQPAKSLLEIQAEEEEMMKREKENRAAATLAIDADAHRINSFKDSLMKGTNITPKTATAIPAGKTIWDLSSPTELSSTKYPETKLPTVLNITKSSAPPVQVTVDKQQHRTAINSGDSFASLSTWCTGKLSRFSNKDRDITTIIELLNDVPDGDVLDLLVELLDDSAYTRKFASEFVDKRKELTNSITKIDESWQSVKKQNSSGDTTSVSNKNAKQSGGKSKQQTQQHRKKMVPVDASKFRSQ